MKPKVMNFTCEAAVTITCNVISTDREAARWKVCEFLEKKGFKGSLSDVHIPCWDPKPKKIKPLNRVTITEIR